jgi:hypothetical protein
MPASAALGDEPPPGLSAGVGRAAVLAEPGTDCLLAEALESLPDGEPLPVPDEAPEEPCLPAESCAVVPGALTED